MAISWRCTAVFSGAPIGNFCGSRFALQNILFTKNKFQSINHFKTINMQTTGNTSGINPTLMSMMYDTTPEELIQIDAMTKDFNEAQIQQFVMIYRTKRKDEQTILLTCLLGVVCFAGLHRFIMGQIGMGILYFFTGGLCFIGTIVDAINHKQLALEFNMKMIGETISMMNMVRR
jgi:TM2 domain-containing membrane protein YozV